MNWYIAAALCGNTLHTDHGLVNLYLPMGDGQEPGIINK